MHNHLMPDRADQIRKLVDEHGEVANRDVSAALGISAATSHRILAALTLSGILDRQGRGRSARYHYRSVRLSFPLAGLDEGSAWQKVAGEIAKIRSLDADEAQSLHYAATEIINNAIDHSQGTRVDISVTFDAAATTTTVITDDGIGVFRRVCEDFALDSPHAAIVELEKGKLTSDPMRHSGEGLFFSSKAMTRFRLESQGVSWEVDNEVQDSGIGASDLETGTRATLTVVAGRTPRLADVFAAHTDPETLQFARTRTTVKLAAVGTSLISRSEAKRISARLAEFEHVTLDFSGVEIVGQGFCDELFRIYAGQHPELTLEPIGMNDAIAFMIGRARAAARR